MDDGSIHRQNLGLGRRELFVWSTIRAPSISRLCCFVILKRLSDSLAFKTSCCCPVHLSSATKVSKMSIVTPALITQFAPHGTACTENRLTMLQNQAFEIWNNAPFPVPGTTFSDCYPSQFMSSLISSAGGTTLPAFSPLKCPENYSTVEFTSSYIACCPRSVVTKHTFWNVAH